MRTHSTKKRTGSKAAKQKGFTLIEVILIVALLGLLGVAALNSYITSSKTFAFLASFNSTTSSIRTARSFALTNKAIDTAGEMLTPDRFGVYIDTDRVIVFADNGGTLLFYDDEGSGTPDSLIVSKTFDFGDTTYEMETVYPPGLVLPIVIFYEKSSGEMTIMQDDGGVYEIIPKGDVKVVAIDFMDISSDLKKYIVITQLSGLPEEFFELPL